MKIQIIAKTFKKHDSDETFVGFTCYSEKTKQKLSELEVYTDLLDDDSSMPKQKLEKAIKRAKKGAFPKEHSLK